MNRPAERAAYLNPLTWSLRRQVLVLGTLLFLVVALAVWFSVMALGASRAVRIAEANDNLEAATQGLVERIQSMRPGSKAGGAPLAEESALRSITEAVLATVPGVEGGFYRTADDRLVGYAYPTYHGSGPKTDIPAAERPSIMRVARQAVASGSATEQRFVAGPDLLLFRAVPLRHEGEVMGAAWVMQNLRGVYSAEQQFRILGAVGLLLILGVVATLTWLVSYRLDRGVSRVEAGLRALEARPDTPIAPTRIRELDRIGAGINRLVEVIRSNQAARSELERRVDRLDRLAALGRLVAGVAHEVRNPLASIRLKLHLAERSREDPERLRAAFAVIDEETERLDRLVSRLLTLAKPAESSALPVDLDRLVRARVELWERQAARHGILLEMTEPPASGPSVRIQDGDRVAQILDNLIANAVDALAARGGRIMISIERPSTATVLITVADTGPGVPSQLVDRLFEPFFTTSPGGTGLGLFLSAELARALDGEIRYRDRPGGGAAFEVHLPC